MTAMNNAPVPVDAVVSLVRELVRIPSRASDDPLGPVLDCIENWFQRHRLAFTRLQGQSVRA